MELKIPSTIIPKQCDVKKMKIGYFEFLIKSKQKNLRQY